MSNGLMPQGVEAGGVGARVLAWIVDGLVPALVVGAAVLVASVTDDWVVTLVAGILSGLVALGWFVFVWWRGASTGVTPGSQLMGLQLVGLRDGRPIGWGRWFLRQLIVSLLVGTVVGGVLLLVFLLTHPNRQGWHDLAVGSVVIRTSRHTAGTSGMSALARPGASSATTTTVGLPPHLAQGMGGFAGATAPGSWQEAPAAPQQGPITQIPTFGQPSGQAPAGQPAAPLAPTGTPAADAAPAPYVAPTAAEAGPVGPVSASPWAGPTGQPAAIDPAAPQRIAAAPQVQPSAPQVQPSAPQVDPVAALGAAAPARVAQPVAAAPSGLGATPAASTAAPSTSPLDEGADATHLAVRPGQMPAALGTWVVSVDTGRTVELERPVLVGRDPQSKPGEDAQLVALGEGSRKVSKTHLLVATDERGPYLVDRGSTNGTALVAEDGGFLPCAAGEKVRLRAGQTVSFGDHSLTISRKA